MWGNAGGKGIIGPKVPSALECFAQHANLPIGISVSMAPHNGVWQTKLTFCMCAHGVRDVHLCVSTCATMN